MKRTSETADIGHSGLDKQNSFRRQNPVSCQLCRSKKLKCDRCYPCSNCVTRRVMCVSALSSEPIFSGESDMNNTETRLRALEEVVFNKRSGQKSPQRNSETSKRLDSIATLGAISMAHTLPQPLYGTSSTIRSKLPSLEAARTIFAHYTAKLNWACHIIHIPTARQQLEGIYATLEASGTPKAPHVALLATIMAAVAYFLRCSGNGASELRPIPEQTSAEILEELAREALAEAKHLTSPTIETLQAAILMIEFLPNQVQDSAFVGRLVHSAHILQLHLVDSAQNLKKQGTKECQAIEIEVKRRMWWYIASTDWLLSFMSGPQCGTYVIHPDQMKVSQPTNLNDGDLSLAGNPSRLSSEHTDVTYTICKIRLAIAIREIVDAACKAGVESEELPYDLLLEFDRKLNNDLDEYPWFYKLDDTSIQQSKIIEVEQPNILLERLLLHFGYHTRICRLHRPYLARGYKDPHYAYSRMMCLRSARMVIQMGQKIQELAIGFNTDFGRNWIVVHHIFVATMILVMDYCNRRDDPQAETRKQEILSCYKILERCQEESTVARTGLEQLKSVMNEWMRKSDGRASLPDASDSAPNPQSLSWIIGDEVQNLWMDSFEFGGLNSDPQWEVLFRDLESQPAINS